MAHAFHDGLPDYDPAATWQKGCPECEHRAQSLPMSIHDIDHETFREAWWRMLRWKDDEEHVVPGPELDLMRALYSLGVILEAHTDLDPFNEPLPFKGGTGGA